MQTQVRIFLHYVAVLLLFATASYLLIRITDLQRQWLSPQWRELLEMITVEMLLLMTALIVLALAYSYRSALTIEVTRTNFQINMEDVMHAFARIFEADRNGMFHLPQQFDAINERLSWVRQQPEFQESEHAVLLLAAEMSVASQNLDHAYGEEVIESAQTLLAQRETQLNQLEVQLREVRAIAAEITPLLRGLEDREDRVRSAHQRELALLQERLAPHGYQLTTPRPTEEIVTALKPPE
jgi:ribosome-associated toxin RatA of RatAB toxin-antitoxin module